MDKRFLAMHTTLKNCVDSRIKTRFFKAIIKSLTLKSYTFCISKLLTHITQLPGAHMRQEMAQRTQNQHSAIEKIKSKETPRHSITATHIP